MTTVAIILFGWAVLNLLFVVLLVLRARGKDREQQAWQDTADQSDEWLAAMARRAVDSSFHGRSDAA